MVKPYVEADAAAERERQAALARSGAVQRGRAQAKAENLRNLRGVLESALIGLKRATVTRDANTPGRDKYNMVHGDAVKACERYAQALGQPVSIVPEWLPPPEQSAQKLMTIAPSAPEPNTVTTMKDKGHSLESAPVYGSRDWMNTQET